MRPPRRRQKALPTSRTRFENQPTNYGPTHAASHPFQVSEHMGKIEKAQKELEASLEAARVAAEASINEKMEKSGEMKNLQMEDMLKKIKEHQEHVKEVRNNQEEMLKPHVEKVQANIKAKEERARYLPYIFCTNSFLAELSLISIDAAGRFL